MTLATSPEPQVARYGGEECAILLPGTDLANAKALAQWMVQAVRELDIPRVKSDSEPDITISIGVASMLPAHEADTADPGPTVLVQAADWALYAAKKAGAIRLPNTCHRWGWSRRADGTIAGARPA